MKRIYFFLSATIILILSGCNTTANKVQTTKSGLDPKNFVGKIDGKPTALYILSNSNGMEACITNYGGRVVSLMVPDRNGKMTDVVLGLDSLSDYVRYDQNFGALIGRYGNRIANGSFTIDGKVYQLPQNNGKHCLHGGPEGFDTMVWDSKQLNDSTLELTLNDTDGHMGFPGNIAVKVIYSLTADNALDISYEATTDKPTVLNLTNHSYFNLSGNPANTVMDHLLQIDSDSITPIDDTFMTTGEMMAVEGTPFDFRKLKTIGEEINAENVQLQNGKGYDHNFVLNNYTGDKRLAATVVSPSSGIKMDVLTDEPGLQLYVGNFLDGTITGKRGVAYPHRSALCLETQHYPDSPNKTNWYPVIVSPGETYRSHCTYRFSQEQ